MLSPPDGTISYRVAKLPKRIRLFSLVTNACAFDAARLRLVIPSWQKSFGSRFDELVVIVDTAAPTGRIADLHGNVTDDDLSEVREVLADLARSDSRIRIEDLPSQEALDGTAKRWFTKDRPMRCQSGTPILAFALAFDSATQNEIVLRADCDMLFFDAGWLEGAIDLLEAGEVDLVEPWGVGELEVEATWVSTRAILVNMTKFADRCLPFEPHRLHFLRRIARRSHGRPTWLALEGMLDLEVAAGRIRHRVLPDRLGSSMHVSTRAEAAIAGMEKVSAAYERGEIPADQIRAGRNFDSSAWKELL